MSSLIRRIRHADNERGQALVEFALILPFLLIVLMGIFEVGRAWQRFQVITDVAREAARVAAYANTDYSKSASDIDDIISQGLLAAGLDPTEATISFPPDAPGAGHGNFQDGNGKIDDGANRLPAPHPSA